MTLGPPLTTDFGWSPVEGAALLSPHSPPLPIAPNTGDECGLPFKFALSLLFPLFLSKIPWILGVNTAQIVSLCSQFLEC